MAVNGHGDIRKNMEGVILSRAEYEREKRDIISEKRAVMIACVIGLCLYTVLSLSAMESNPGQERMLLLFMLILDALMVFGMINTSGSRQSALAVLDEKYRKSLRMANNNRKS